MSDWSAGYVSELGYTYGYYHELNTQRVDLCLLHQALNPPKIRNALELGFGQGISINIHAAASEVSWTGTDFNPSQANFAAQLASEAGITPVLLDDSFEEFLSREDIPQFDYIGLHGIWSWISDKNRRIITEIIRHKLAVGGVVYASYNTMPGWAGFSPMRHLMTQHARVLGSFGKGIVNRIDDAFKFTDELIALNPKYIAANPQSRERLSKLKDQNRHYLAHEFFNKDWHPMHFAEIADLLSDAKLDFAASANLLDHVDYLHLSPDQQKFLHDIPDLTLRETVRDFILNQQFRKDYWVKGAVKLNVDDRLRKLRALRVVLTVPKNKVSMTVKVGLGDATLSETIYIPIIEAIGEGRISTIGEIEDRLGNQTEAHTEHAGINQIIQAIVVLVGTGQVELAQDSETISKKAQETRNLNTILLNKAASSGDISYLASPVTGGGVNVNRIEQMFINSIHQGINEPSKWAKEAWDTLSARGQRLVANGVAIESEQDNLNELITRATDFSQHRISVLENLKIL